MAIVSAKPAFKIEAYQGQLESLYVLPKLKKRKARFDKNKKAMRIIKNLSDDALSQTPDVRVPSTWMLRSIIETHLCGDLETNWLDSIYMTLTYIAQSSASNGKLASTFTQGDKKLPLFPNDQGYTLKDLHRFSRSLIRYLDHQRTSVCYQFQ